MVSHRTPKETNDLKWKRMRLIMDRLKEKPMLLEEIEQLVCKSQTDKIGRRSVQNYLAELIALQLVSYDSKTKLYEWIDNKMKFQNKHEYDVALKHSRNLVLTTPKRRGLDQTNPCRALDLLVYESDRDINYQCFTQHLRTGYFHQIYALMEKYHQLMDETALSETEGLPKLFSVVSSWDGQNHRVEAEEKVTQKNSKELVINSFPMKGDMLMIDVNSVILGSSSPNIKYVHKTKYKEIVDLRDLLVGRICSVVNDVIQGIPLRGFCDHCPNQKITIEGTS
jgi:hypothetical protein